MGLDIGTGLSQFVVLEEEYDTLMK